MINQRRIKRVLLQALINDAAKHGTRAQLDKRPHVARLQFAWA